jgi:hypothetical protein
LAIDEDTRISGLPTRLYVTGFLSKTRYGRKSRQRQEHHPCNGHPLPLDSIHDVAFAPL